MLDVPSPAFDLRNIGHTVQSAVGKVGFLGKPWPATIPFRIFVLFGKTNKPKMCVCVIRGKESKCASNLSKMANKGRKWDQTVECLPTSRSLSK